MAKATAEGAVDRLNAYENAVANSQAVINRSLQELVRLCYSEDQVYATFYQRVDAGMHLAGGDSWDRRRAIADTILFGDVQKRSIRFGALTLDEVGLPHYGECSLLLREEMISHRTSVFEENAAVFVKRKNIQGRKDFAVPPGHRATWDDRKRLAVVKIMSKTLPTHDNLGVWLLKSGMDETKDSFIEAHIWGTLTIRSFKKVVIRSWQQQPSPTQIQVVEEKLRAYNIDVQMP